MPDYEAERLANIARNSKLLEELRIPKKVGDVPQPYPHGSTSTSTTVKRKRASAHASGRTRRSTRLASVQDGLSAGHSGSLSPPPSVPILRSLSQPSVPPSIHTVAFDPARRAPLPTRDEDGTLSFKDTPYFTPNVTPAEMLAWGSFGGTAFKAHYSSVLKRTLPCADVEEFPLAWYEDLPDSSLYSLDYDSSVNRYAAKAGQSLTDWERAGWIHEQDPRGWFQWYCRFYSGRRTADDDRQIKRWLGVCGPAGRFRKGLVKKLVRTGKAWDDEQEGKVLRQTLQHWAYRLTESHYGEYLSVHTWAVHPCDLHTANTTIPSATTTCSAKLKDSSSSFHGTHRVRLASRSI